MVLLSMFTVNGTQQSPFSLTQHLPEQPPIVLLSNYSKTPLLGPPLCLRINGRYNGVVLLLG